MRRTLEPIDLIVVIGICANVVGGSILFMSTSGAFAVTAPETVSVGLASEREWIQPLLGQAIVDTERISREASAKLKAVTTKLDRAIESGRKLNGALSSSIRQIEARAAETEQEHAARVQFVMGQLIVSSTARGVRQGVLSPAQLAGAYNQQIIRITELTGERMNAQFLSHRQANLDQALAGAREAYEAASARSQERIGEALVLASRAQRWLESAQEAAQHQVAAAALAAVRVERQAALAASLPGEEGLPLEPVAPVRLRTWPELPFAGFFVASMALVGVFVAGIMVPGRQPHEEGRQAEQAYRKTA
jgi:hypothetical protein